MAIAIACANTAWTTSTTWATVDATSALDSELANTALTTSFVESATFTPGAITIDGIAFKIASRGAVPTGTMDIRLAQAGSLVAGTAVSINISDIDSRAAEQGWYFFKFATPVTLLGATLYSVSAKTGTAAMVNLYRNGTAGNWSRLLRTTTTASPAAGDSVHIMGEWTGAGVVVARTVTMDQTATTDYGDNTTANPPGFTIGKGGTLTWGTAAATAYRLRMSTTMFIYRGGVVNMGTTGTPCPRGSSQLQEFDCLADGDFGLVCYGTFIAQGLSRTAGKIVTQCLLAANAISTATSMTVDTDTGWLSGDDIAIGSTTRTNTQAETRALTGDATSSTLAVSALTNAHGGVAPVQAEVILLTRNVRVESVSTSFMAYAAFGQASTVDLDWMSFRYLGNNLGGNKSGVTAFTTSAGTFAMSFCSMREFDHNGFMMNSATNDNIAIDNTVAYLTGRGLTGQACFDVSVATSGVNWSIDTCTAVQAASFGSAFRFRDFGGRVQRIKASSAANIGIDMGGEIDGVFGAGANVWTDFTVHSCGGIGLQIGASGNGVKAGRIDNLNAWRNGGSGVDLSTFNGDIILATGSIFGNTAQNMSVNAGIWGQLYLRSLTLAGDTTFSVANGILYGASSGAVNMIMDACLFGPTSGILVTHATSDINFGSNVHCSGLLLLRNTQLLSTEFGASTGLLGRMAIRRERLDGTVNTHNTVYPALGTVAYDTVTFHTASPSEKLTPNGAVPGMRLRSGSRFVPVLSGNTKTISAWVQKDGSYVGSAPRLLLLANAAIGINDDVVLATFSASSGTWQQLSGTTAAATDNGVFEVCLDCDGSAGNVYTDDWATT